MSEFEMRYPFVLRHDEHSTVTISSSSSLRDHTRRAAGLSTGFISMASDSDLIDILRAKGWRKGSST